MDDNEHELEHTAPVQEQAETQAASAVEDVKTEIDKRDDAIIAELRAIHDAINQQTEHHIRHLEAHTLSSQAPVQAAASTVAEKLPDDPVSLEISEPQDMPKEESKEHTKSRKFGKRGKRA